MQRFSDAVFALAATLLVVTIGEVPGSYEELLEALTRFPTFALAFAAIVSLWWNHRQFFAAYPLADVWTVTLNGVLLLVVLLYVYPLKLLAEVVSERFLGATPGLTAGMGGAEIQGLFVIFGAAVAAVAVVLAAMHARAWRLRERLELDQEACSRLRREIALYGGIAAVAGVSMLFGALGLGIGWGLPFWIYALSPGAAAVERLYGRRASMRAAAE